MESSRRWLVLAAVVVATLSAAVDETAGSAVAKVRTRRDITELGKLVSEVTGKGLLDVLMTYNGYGCYCGLGGFGTPVDDIDRCCQEHDRCLGEADEGVCSDAGKGTLSVSYRYRVQEIDTRQGLHAKITCAPASAYKTVVQGVCSETVCNCDKNVAICFAQHELDKQYHRYDRKNCK